MEAQELLARLALEDNNNAKAVEEANKALAHRRRTPSQAKAILATIDWLADKKETAWDPHDARGYETAGHFFMLNRRYEEAIAVLPQGHRARPELVQRALAAGHQPHAPGPGRGSLQQLETCWDNGFQDKRHQELADA